MLAAETTLPPKPAPTPFPVATVALVAVSLAVLGVELACGLDARLVVRFGGNIPRETLHGQWWRVATSLPLCSSPSYLVLNLVTLLHLRRTEARFGRVGFALVFVIGGLTSAVAELVVASPIVVTAGDATGVYAIYGAYLASLAITRRGAEVTTWRTNLGSAAAVLGLNMVIVIGSGAPVAPIVAPLVAGALAGIVVCGRDLRPAARARRGAIALVAASAIAAGVLAALPGPTLPLHHRDLHELGVAGELVREYWALDEHREDMDSVLSLEQRAAATRVSPDDREIIDALLVALEAERMRIDAVSAGQSERLPELWQAATHARDALDERVAERTR